MNFIDRVKIKERAEKLINEIFEKDLAEDLFSRETSTSGYELLTFVNTDNDSIYIGVTPTSFLIMKSGDYEYDEVTNISQAIKIIKNAM